MQKIDKVKTFLRVLQNHQSLQYGQNHRIAKIIRIKQTKIARDMAKVVESRPNKLNVEG